MTSPKDCKSIDQVVADAVRSAAAALNEEIKRASSLGLEVEIETTRGQTFRGDKGDKLVDCEIVSTIIRKPI